MEEWKVNITKAENGFIMSWKENLDDNTTVIRRHVSEETYYYDSEYLMYEELQGVDSEKVAFTRMVYALADHFGFTYNKYGSDNLKITWDSKGEKLE